MKAPVLEFEQHSVLCAEVDTGIVLNTDFERYQKGENAFHIFDTCQLALRFVHEKLIDNPDLEFIIYDTTGKHFLTKDFYGVR